MILKRAIGRNVFDFFPANISRSSLIRRIWSISSMEGRYSSYCGNLIHPFNDMGPGRLVVTNPRVPNA